MNYTSNERDSTKTAERPIILPFNVSMCTSIVHYSTIIFMEQNPILIFSLVHMFLAPTSGQAYYCYWVFSKYIYIYANKQSLLRYL